MVSFVLAVTALALDVHLANSEEEDPNLEMLGTFPGLKLPSEMKETDWVHFGDKMRLKVTGKDQYLHWDTNGWVYIKAGAAGNTEFIPLSIFPSNPGAHGRLSFGQKFYLHAAGSSMFVRLGDEGDVRQGDNFLVSNSVKRTTFHMIDWPKAMEVQWGDKVKLASRRGQMLYCKQSRACVDPEQARGGIHFELVAATPKKAAKKQVAKKK